MAKRVVITCLNIVFPPLAVAMLTGATSPDTLINCVLFLLAIIPSHIHGFYISLTYFNRKRKVRRGKWPGRDRAGIYSDKVQTGGIGREAAKELREQEKLAKKRGRRYEKYDDYGEPVSPVSTTMSGRNSMRSNRSGHRMSNRYSGVPPTSYQTQPHTHNNRYSGMSQMSPVSPVSPATSHRRVF